MNERILKFKEIIQNYKENYDELISYQLLIKKEIIDYDPPNINYNRFAGIDVAYDDEKGYAACVIYDLQENSIIKKQTAISEISFPYVSTLFSFREGPIILKLFETLNIKEIDLLFLNGHGLMHPRIGLASHIGYLLDIPTVGIASNYLVGTYEQKLLEKGENIKIFDGNKLIGFVYQSQSRVKPIYISVGHKISLTTALKMTAKLIINDKFPIPLLEAHNLANQIKSKNK
ncbi:MAG: endonuclease V [Candidatus Lokiarchaeota archaeon]|nr:endonuclease V [Candidatus Lokiarchaeota archaeon]